MGSAASKSSAKIPISASTKLPRKYPTRSPALSQQPQPPVSLEQPHAHKPLRPKTAHTAPTTKPIPQFSRHKQAATEAPESNFETESETADPGLLGRLQSLGPVQPNPTYSPSSTFNNPDVPFPPSPIPSNTTFSKPSPATQTTTNPNAFRPSPSTPHQAIYPSHLNTSSPSQNPAISLLTARYRLAAAADEEFASIGKSTHKGREFLDVYTIRQVLEMMEKGKSAEVIEKDLRLKTGVVGRLGRRGVVGVGGSDQRG